jgi:hypothetical protein
MAASFCSAQHNGTNQVFTLSMRHMKQESVAHEHDLVSCSPWSNPYLDGHFCLYCVTCGERGHKGPEIHRSRP